MSTPMMKTALFVFPVLLASTCCCASASDIEIPWTASIADASLTWPRPASLTAKMRGEMGASLLFKRSYSFHCDMIVRDAWFGGSDLLHQTEIVTVGPGEVRACILGKSTFYSGRARLNGHLSRIQRRDTTVFEFVDSVVRFGEGGSRDKSERPTDRSR